MIKSMCDHRRRFRRIGGVWHFGPPCPAPPLNQHVWVLIWINLVLAPATAKVHATEPPNLSALILAMPDEAPDTYSGTSLVMLQ
jgi:hypothetical protein